MKTKQWLDIMKFYLIAIAFTWSIAGLIIIEWLPLWAHYLVGFGPMIASLVMNKFRLSSYKLFWHTRRPVWFWVGWTSPLWITVIAYLIATIFGQSTPGIELLGEINFLGNIGWWVFPFWVITFGLGEEMGWRGFLLPRLQTYFSPLVSTFIVFVLWSLWHLPFFFYLPTYLAMNGGALIGFLMSLFSGTIVLTWLFNRSGNSLPTLILWHGMFNVITASTFGEGLFAMSVSMVIIIISVIVVTKWIIDDIKTKQKPSVS